MSGAPVNSARGSRGNETRALSLIRALRVNSGTLKQKDRPRRTLSIRYVGLHQAVVRAGVLLCGRLAYHFSLRRQVSSAAALWLRPTLCTLSSLNETYCGRWIVACCLAHPVVCRCCNLCPKSTGSTQRLVRPQRFASHFPFALSPSSTGRRMVVFPSVQCPAF
jgi:hypothetical protein